MKDKFNIFKEKTDDETINFIINLGFIVLIFIFIDMFFKLGGVLTLTSMFTYLIVVVIICIYKLIKHKKS